jgi:hypothetical protein
MNLDPAPGPEGLLLELLDLLALFFPQGMGQATLHFEPASAGDYPGLTEITGEAAPDPTPRPALGYSDEDVLNSVNAVLRDLTDATDAEAKIRILRGRLQITWSLDPEAVEVWLVQSQGGEAEDDLIVMKKQFSASELGWLLFSPTP